MRIEVLLSLIIHCLFVCIHPAAADGSTPGKVSVVEHAAVFPDADLSVKGCQAVNVIHDVIAGERFGFAVYIDCADSVRAVELELVWDSELAVCDRAYTRDRLPENSLDLNGVTDLLPSAEINMLAGESAPAIISGDKGDGHYSITVASTSGPVSGGGLAGFAAFRALQAFEYADVLVIEVRATLHCDSTRISCTPSTVTVHAESPFLELTGPGETEQLVRGVTIPVTWVSYGAHEAVVLSFSRDGAQWREITSQAWNDVCSYDWTVPEDATRRSGLRIESRDVHGRVLTDEVALNVVRAPLVKIEALGGGADASIPFKYSILHSAEQSHSLICEYSLDGGVQWRRAAVDRDMSSLGRDRFAGIVVWRAASSLVRYLGPVMFRIRDVNDTGESAGVAILDVDYKYGPVVTVDQPPEIVKGVVSIEYTVSGEEDEAVSVCLEYSRDGGVTWMTADVADDTGNIAADGSLRTLSWFSRADLPDILLSGVRLRIAVNDGDKISYTETRPFTVDNGPKGKGGSFYRGRNGGVPVIAMHNVDYNLYDNAGLSMTPTMLERILVDLKREGFTFLSMDRYMKYIMFGEPVPEKSLLITFDDGYVSMFQRVYPIMRKHDVCASMGIICGRVGSSGYLDYAKIRRMQLSGLFDFQSHSFSLHKREDHGPAIKKRPLETDAAYRYRILNDFTASFNHVAKMSGVEPIAFVLPYGVGNSLVAGIAEEAGYDGVFYIGHDRANEFGDDPYHLDRISVSRHNAHFIAEQLAAHHFSGVSAAPHYSDAAYKIAAGIPDVVMACRIPGGVFASSPALAADGTIYIGSWDNALYAVGRDGDIRWRFETGGGISTSPAVGPDGSVYIGSYDRFLYCLTADGEKKWRFDGWDSLVSSPAVDVDGSVYFGSIEGGIFGVNARGEGMWNYRSGDAVYSSPAIAADGTVISGTWNNRLVAIGPDGSARWKFLPGNAVESSPAIDSDGVVYAGCMTGKFHAVSPDGKELWQYDIGSWIESSPSIGPDSQIYIGGRDGLLYCFDRKGALLWTFQTGGRIESTPAVGADGCVYFGSWDGFFYAVEPDGKERWRFQTGGGITCSPVLSDDGIVYFASTDSWLYGLDTGTDRGLADSAWPCFHADVQNTGRVPSRSMMKKHMTETAVLAAKSPQSLDLNVPVPNPFNPSTTVRFFLPDRMKMTIDVYSITGQKVQCLISDVCDKGRHAVTWDASGLPSGVYIVRLKSGGISVSRKATLLK